jgi:hypothetical protein
MRRIGVLAYLAVWLTLPASSHAATPPGSVPIGPPATLLAASGGLGPGDHGQALTCRATARTAWGSVTLRSSNGYRVARPA